MLHHKAEISDGTSIIIVINNLGAQIWVVSFLMQVFFLVVYM